jgi:hypothetical protein
VGSRLRAVSHSLLKHEGDFNGRCFVLSSTSKLDLRKADSVKIKEEMLVLPGHSGKKRPIYVDCSLEMVMH